MKIFITFILSMSLLSTVNASLVAIVDSGVDYTHPDLVDNMWKNLDESLCGEDHIDNDKNGYVDDFNGWNMADNNNEVFDFKYQYLVTPEVLRFYNLIAMSKLGKVTQEDFDWFNIVTKDQKFMEIVDFAGNYAHGTHVAGITRMNNDQVELLTVKYLKVDYKGLLEKSLVSIRENSEINKVKSVEDIKDGEKREEQIDLSLLKDFFNNLAIKSALQLQKVSNYVSDKNVRVLNGSFGLGFKRGLEIVFDVFYRAYGVYPSDEQALVLTDYFLTASVVYSGIAIKSAPETLFVFAAGNDGLNNDILKDSPANADVDNSISVAATFEDFQLADFSNYGLKKVDVAAPGVNIKSAAPGNNHMYISGTSQAAPYVTNIAAKLFDINSQLTPKIVKAILIKTVDKKSFLTGKVKSGGIVNERRAIYVAKAMKLYGFTFEDAVKNSYEAVKSSNILKGNRAFSADVNPLGSYVVPRPSML